MFLNKEASKVAGISQRQCQHWTVAGLVVPAREAKSAGASRGYSRTNCLELALCRELFDFGLGIFAIKKLMEILRESGKVRDWSDNFGEYWAYWAEKFRESTKQLSIGWPKFIEQLDDEELHEFGEGQEKMTQRTWALKFISGEFNKVPEKPVGVLFYFFRGASEKNYLSVLPIDIEWALLWEETKKRIAESRTTMIIDLGAIAEEVDKRIAVLV